MYNPPTCIGLALRTGWLAGGGIELLQSFNSCFSTFCIIFVSQRNHESRAGEGPGYTGGVINNELPT